MTTIWLIAKKELSSYLNTSWGISILAIILLLDGLLFNAFALGSSPRYSADVLEDFFYFSSGTTMVAGILLTMRLWAEERKASTLEILLTLPVPVWQLVLAKFLATWSFTAIALLLSFHYG